MYVCMYVCIYFISFFLSFLTSFSFFYYINYTQKSPPKIVYFSVWPNALLFNASLKILANELLNGRYAISTNPPPPQYTELYNKNDLYIVAWKEFNIPPEKIKNNSYLWQLETPFSISVPPSEAYKEHFYKIFTYHKPSCDGKKVIYIPIPYNYDEIITDYNISKKDTLLMHVGMYGTNHHYIQRTESIRWFLENHPNDILFYGVNWNRLKSSLSKNAKIHFDKKYGGFIPEKIKTISRAKFVLAYENKRFEDYVSEKIYDVMAAGSVPIYSGASNIKDHVPEACFIDFHKFKNHEELYTYISTMPDETYMSYLNCIQKYMSEPEKNPNHPKKAASIILSHIRTAKSDSFMLSLFK